MYFKNGNRRLKSYSVFISVVAVFYSGLFLMHFSYYEHKPTALPTISTPCHREQLLRQVTCPQKLHVLVMKKLKSAVGNVVSQSKKKVSCLLQSSFEFVPLLSPPLSEFSASLLVIHEFPGLTTQTYQVPTLLFLPLSSQSSFCFIT